MDDHSAVFLPYIPRNHTTYETGEMFQFLFTLLSAEVRIL